MHIPDGMLEGVVCPVTAVAAAAGLGGAALAAARHTRPPSPLAFASVSAFVFAAQMVNFPVAGGTSGHLLGGVLASAVLGVPHGILCLALVLTVQALIFADGGLAVLGANIFNMALVGAGLGGWLAGWRGDRSPAAFARLGAAAWLSVTGAALACCAQLALSGASPFGVCAPPMLGIHAWIGLAEAGLTCALVAVMPVLPSARSPRPAWIWLGAAAVVALVLAPWASPLPDGLEWAAETAGFFKEAQPFFVSPLADYSAAGLPEGLSTSVAGLAGVAITAALGWLVLAAFRSKPTT